MNRNPTSVIKAVVGTLTLLISSVALSAQQTNGNTLKTAATPIVESEFDRHLDELTSKLESMRQQLVESQNEMAELRRELRDLREQLTVSKESQGAARDADSLRASVAQLQDETEILQAEVKQHDQTKVETLSKYPVRINGALLLTSVLNGGNPDNINVPVVALPTGSGSLSGSLSATVSQSMLGLDATGPHVWGARSSADLSVDFWGGTSASNYTPTAGNVRLRTMHAQVEWPQRAITVAIDRPLISPWQPTSWVTVAEPPLAWSGNLWAWLPQVKFKENDLLFKHLNADVGLIFPSAPYAYVVGETPQPSASERSRQPGYAARIGPELSWRDHPLTFGLSGYYSRQAYAYDQHVDAWSGGGDWSLVLSRAIQWSGEIYRGRGIGSLGGGAFKDYVSNSAADSLRGLDAAGGWTQAKITILPSLEANISTGLDNAFAHEIRGSDQAAGSNYYGALTRNQTVLANLVFRPKSYLLLSTEFRQIDSRFIWGSAGQDRIFGIATGYIF